MNEKTPTMADLPLYWQREIESLRFELSAARNEIEIADGEIERLTRSPAAGAAWDAVQAARDAEREHCAELAEQLCDQGRDGHQIAKVIRAGKLVEETEASPDR